MLFMARAAQSNIVFQDTAIFPVYVRPLDYFRLIASSATIRALSWSTFLPTNPVMESTVTYLLSFPSIMVSSRLLTECRETSLIKFGHSFLGHLGGYSIPHQFFVPSLAVTFARAIISWFDLGRRAIHNVATRFARDFNHGVDYRLYLGEMQV